MTSCSANRRRTRGAFTLVELLVVIGIIAILISVLLPALSAARRSAGSVRCLSNLRQLAYAFQMYAGANKNAYPVTRVDFPLDAKGLPPTAQGAGVQNVYWTDMLFPYVLKTAFPTQSFTKMDAANYRKSALWCPTWEADHPEYDPYANYNDRFKNGYAYNLWPTFRPDYPRPDAFPTGEVNGWSYAAPGVGKWTRKHEWSQPADRLLIADSNLWIVSMTLTNAAGLLSPQRVGFVQEASWNGSGPGAMNIDRFRHGKYPGSDGNLFRPTGGKMAYNILYADGHAATATDMATAYKAVRMRYP